MNAPDKKRVFSQHGVALITAMLVVSLATITAVAMTAEQQIFFRRSENILHHQQAYLYLLGAEDWAKQVLARDLTNNQTDTKQDDWATVLPPIAVEGGAIGGTIEDLQGRFNINNLADAQVQQAELDRFTALLALYQIPASLSNAVLDWLDADDQARFPDGAEDIDYMQAQQAYRAGNGPMSSVSELLKVRGMTYEMYERIAPALVALPTTASAINVNTAPPLVLRMIVTDLSEQDAEALARDLAQNPVEQIEDFLAHALVQGKQVATSGIDVRSNYFLVRAYARIGRARATLNSIVLRMAPDNISTVLRSQGDV